MEEELRTQQGFCYKATNNDSLNVGMAIVTKIVVEVTWTLQELKTGSHDIQTYKIKEYFD